MKSWIFKGRCVTFGTACTLSSMDSTRLCKKPADSCYASMIWQRPVWPVLGACLWRVEWFSSSVRMESVLCSFLTLIYHSDSSVNKTFFRLSTVKLWHFFASTLGPGFSKPDVMFFWWRAHFCSAWSSFLDKTDPASAKSPMHCPLRNFKSSRDLTLRLLEPTIYRIE